MEFSRSEYWSGQLFPSPGDLPNPGIKPRSPALNADSLPAEPERKHNKRTIIQHTEEENAKTTSQIQTSCAVT